MERNLLIAMGFWVSGAGAWVVGAGYILAPRMASYVRPRLGWSPDMQELPRSPDMIATVEDPGESESTLATTEIVGDSESLQRLTNIEPRPLQLIEPIDGSALLTDSQRRRLAPVNQLKRKRRSRKVRIAGGGSSEKFIPLVEGARQSVDEAIIASYAGETLTERQLSGEDYFVDPTLYMEEITRERQAMTRRKKFTRKPDAFAEQRLRNEIAAPYKSNLIGIVVLGVGAIVVIFSLFPHLLENDVSVASFPAVL